MLRGAISTQIASCHIRRTDKVICRGRFAPKILHAKDSEKMCCYLVAVITAAIAVAADTVLGVAVIRQAAVAGG